MQVALLGNRGVTAAKTQTALKYLDSLTGTLPRSQDQTINFGKVDWQAREHDRFSLEYNRARSSSAGGGRSAAVVNRGLASFGNTDVSVDAVIGRWIHTLNDHLSNEARAQYGRDLHLERAQTPLAQEPAIGPNGFAPEVAIGPQGLIFGTPASASQGPSPDERRTQGAEVLTFVHGGHVLQAGGDVSYVQDHVEALANAEGTFHYDSGTTGGHAGGLVDWITDYTFSVNSYPNGGCPSINAPIHEFCFRSFSQSFGAQDSRFSTQEWAAFVQDDWRLHKGLNLSAGLRYEYEFLPLPQHPNAALDQVFGATGATSIFPEDRNNLGPRVGLAWQPFGSERSTVRAGYGLYFGRLPGATIRSALTETASASTVTRIRILPTVETACPQVSNQGFWLSVRVSDGSARGCGEYDLGNPVRSSLSPAGLTAGDAGDRTGGRERNHGPRKLPAEPDAAAAELDRHQHRTGDSSYYLPAGWRGPITRRSQRRFVLCAAVHATHRHRLWAGDGHRLERECELQRAGARSKPAYRPQRPAAWELDLVEDDRLWGEWRRRARAPTASLIPLTIGMTRRSPA